MATGRVLLHRGIACRPVLFLLVALFGSGFPPWSPCCSAGWIWGVNRASNGLDAPILEADGVTRLAGRGGDPAGSTYLVEFWVGARRDDLRLVNSSALLTGPQAGYVDPCYLNTEPPAGTTLYVQMRVLERREDLNLYWSPDADKYGARSAVSDIVQVVAGTLEKPGMPLGWKPVVLGPPRLGTVTFANQATPLLDAPVFGLDGTTRLVGPDYVAQLFVRRADLPAAELRAVGSPAVFGTGPLAGYWNVDTDDPLALDGIGAHQAVVGRVYVWERALGGSLDEAIHAGGAIGASSALAWTSGAPDDPKPPVLTGLGSFRLTPPSAGTLDLRDRTLQGHGPRLTDYVVGAWPPGRPLARPHVAQVLVGHGASDLAPVTDPMPLGEAAGAGYWTPPGNGILTLPPLLRGERVWVVLRAWDGSVSADYEGLPTDVFGRISQDGVWVRLGGEGFLDPTRIPDHVLKQEPVERASVDFRASNRVFTATGGLLEDTNFVAQLHSADTDRPLGEPARFIGGSDPGRWQPDPARPIVVVARRMVTCCYDYDVRIWDLRHGSTYASAGAGLRTRSRRFSLPAGNRPYVLKESDLGELRLPGHASPALEIRRSDVPWVLASDGRSDGFDEPGYRAQLHVIAGDSAAARRFALGEGGEAIGPIAPIGTETRAGVWEVPTATTFELADYQVPSVVHLQLRVWESARGASYAEATRHGSRTGRSEVTRLTVDSAMLQTARTLDIASFPMDQRGWERIAGPGLSFIGNPTARGAVRRLDWFLELLWGTVPQGLTLFSFDAATQSYLQATYRGTEWLGDPGPLADPGHGFFVFNPTGRPLTLTFLGWPGRLPSLSRPHGLPAHFTRANTLGRSATFEEIAGIPPMSGDAVFRFVDGAWQMNDFEFGGWRDGSAVLPADGTWFLRLVPQ